MDVEMSCAEMIENAHRLGHDYKAPHGDCCRCRVAALQSAIKFVPNDKGLFRAASCVETLVKASEEIARKPSGGGQIREYGPILRTGGYNRSTTARLVICQSRKTPTSISPLL